MPYGVKDLYNVLLFSPQGLFLYLLLDRIHQCKLGFHFEGLFLTVFLCFIWYYEDLKLVFVGIYMHIWAHQVCTHQVCIKL